jgi:geranylgeranyl diphosphate synthase, type II
MSKVLDFEQANDDIFGLAQYLLECVDVELERIVTEVDCAEQLRCAARYMLFPRGKRIRPLLSLLLCHDLRGDVKLLLPVAAAIELLHTASLIHDDLPALDNDDLRRGRSSCHIAFGEATALLTGDFMVSLAFDVILKSSFENEAKILLLSKAAASYSELCSGQQLDILPPGAAASARVNRLKTGSLFSLSCCFGGVGAKSGGAPLSILEELGFLLGEFFQFVDDLLDKQGSADREGLTEIKGAIDVSCSNLRREVGGSLRGFNYVLAKIEEQLESAHKPRGVSVHGSFSGS